MAALGIVFPTWVLCVHSDANSVSRLQQLSLSAKAQGGQTRTYLKRTLECDRQTLEVRNILILHIVKFALKARRGEVRGIVVVTLPDQADSVLDPWGGILGSVEDDEIEPAEAVTVRDGVFLALLQTGGSGELNGLESVDGTLVEGLFTIVE